MGLKGKVQEASDSVKNQLEYMKKDSKYLKTFIQSKKNLFGTLIEKENQ